MRPCRATSTRLRDAYGVAREREREDPPRCTAARPMRSARATSTVLDARVLDAHLRMLEDAFAAAIGRSAELFALPARSI